MLLFLRGENILDYSLIIKLTNACNLNCSYCYHRRDGHRNMHAHMAMETLEAMIRKLLANNTKTAEFIWHGGEPLLTGIDTFRSIVALQKRYNVNNLPIKNSVQTNGTLLTREFIDFFIEHDFSIGISLDGPLELHAAERGTLPQEYDKINTALRYLHTTNAKYGTLCVVTKNHIGKEQEIFDMICDLRIGCTAFLPCMVQANGIVDKGTTISPEEFGTFLVNMFDIWTASTTRGLSVRNFDDCLRFFLGKRPKTCICLNICDSYLTVLPGGEIFLCDNFCSSEKYHVGDIKTGFDSIANTAPMKKMRNAMENIPDECEGCPYFCACRGGCKYYRYAADVTMVKKQYYCESWKMLYDHVKPLMQNRGQ